MERALITVPAAIAMVALTGPQDSYLRIFEATFPNLRITFRGNEIFAKGEDAERSQFEVLITMKKLKTNLFLYYLIALADFQPLAQMIQLLAIVGHRKQSNDR